MTYEQIVGLVFLVFRLSVLFIIIQQFVTISEGVLFKTIMSIKKEKKIAEEPELKPYKGEKNKTNEAIDVQNRIGFR